MWIAVIVLFIVLAAACFALARIGFAGVKDYIDAQAADGEVETYTSDFHSHVRDRLNVAAWTFASLSVALLFLRRLFFAGRSSEATGTTSFRADLRAAMRKVWKRTSTGHKRLAFFLILAGTVLRCLQLSAPVIYDEAFTYTYYATRPFHLIISDYSYPNNHIFHTLLVKWSTMLFGVGHWQIRLPALLAGVIAMPLFYLFVRAMFNRYIAMMALALVASSGALIEYSALARGYSITWVCYLAALLLGRHFAKENSLTSALLIAVVNAIGMWTVPTMIYASVAIYIWLLLYLFTRYDTSLQQRINRLILSGLVFVALTLILYAPVMVVHGFAQLFYHPTMGDNTWESFKATHQDSTFALWAYFTDTAAQWVSLLGVLGLLYAVYVSSKFRLLLFALILGAVPLVIVQMLVGPPRVWTYALFVLHISNAIALFYLLKLIHDRVSEGFTERIRTTAASLVLLVGFSVQAVRVLPDRIERYADARVAARDMKQMLGPGDRVVVEFPWEAPLEFYLSAEGMARQQLHLDPAPGAWVYIMVSPSNGQSPEGVLLHNKIAPERLVDLKKILDRKHLEIFAARMR